MSTKTKKYLYFSIMCIGILGLIASSYFANIPDMVRVVAYIHGFSLYFQSGVYVIVFVQILTFKKVRNLITIRHQTEYITKFLIKLVILDWFIFWICSFLPYAIFNHAQLFKYGKPTYGLLILMLHMLVMLMAMLIIVSSYYFPYPYLIVIFVIFITLMYHYNFERSILLPRYSHIFNPLWQAMHNEYY
ncbi:hypothetical protein J2Z60_000547 [Lactobacillus colini]|uniref:Beta-carotene 15,15'-monooxygenase n=1 Tax=Lactobacillus colini TaxID=1819254 RepID=A0ABS4MCH7_9LACO|nr:hypothetical protein [Lactobacillus colini]MBP2057383.1 hypothetical protein [Lactobacillus colini]